MLWLPTITGAPAAAPAAEPSTLRVHKECRHAAGIFHFKIAN